MIVLPKIFASGALYLQSAPLEIRGRADAGATLAARILRSGDLLSEGKAVADGEGNFALPLVTPAASLLPCEIEISDGSETVTLTDILFGELWLACGQSNMEMAADLQPEWEEMLRSLSGKAIRVFTAPRLPNNGNYPIDPVTDTDGWWVGPDDGAKLGRVSALATAFSLDLYEYFCKTGREIPVGFCNCSRGGTNIETWIPREVFLEKEELRAFAQDRERWNQKDGENYHQSSAYYNLNTHPHLGIKARGMLWYQGESNLVHEQSESVYRSLLVALRESYASRFSPSEDAPFPIVSSQIYPWKYRDGSDACVGYFNRVFSELAKEDPLRYPFVPLADLPPIWSYHTANHPIHPAHKFSLGARFATIVENLLYGGAGQTLPATLVSCVRHGERLRLTFRDVGAGLYLKDSRISGLYVRSDKGAYVPAKCEIEGKRVLWVWADGVRRPRHVAYAVSTHEVEATLMAGELPVAPFCTEFSETVRNVTVNRKAWLDPVRSSEFVISPDFSDSNRDAGYKPIFYPVSGSTLSVDPFTAGKPGLRIESDGERFGVYTVARNGAALDLGRYASLSVSLYNAAQLESTLVLDYAERDGKRLSLPLAPASGTPLGFGRERLTYDLTSLPEGEIARMTFAFRRVGGSVSLAIIDGISLVASC
jgi:sialate O-acetylesterase